MRVIRFLILLSVSWCVMTFTHEIGHVIGGWVCGGHLKTAELRPWQLPYSIFNPDPYPLVTLWSGPILGVVIPVGLALFIRQSVAWFVASFCVLANGLYLAVGGLSGDNLLDTSQLLQHGAHPLSIGLYCLVTISIGYVGFRRSCIRVFSVNDRKNGTQPISRN